MLKKIMHIIAWLLPESNRWERIWILAKTDFIQRYYGSALGVFWAFIKPVIQVFVYLFAFTVLFKSDIENYALYIFSGILTYNFFAESTKAGSKALRTKRYLIENIPISKMEIYIASLLSSFLGLAINFSMYFFLSLFFTVDYTIHVVWFPLLILNLCILSLAVMMFLSALNIFLRDLDHIWDMVILIGFWATPIIYGKELVLKAAPFLLYINPLAGIIINVREVIIYSSPPIYDILLIDLIFAIAILMVAIPINRHYSKKAAEVM